MSAPLEIHRAAPLPPAEKWERWPAWCAGALAVAETVWQLLPETERLGNDARPPDGWAQTWLRPPGGAQLMAAGLGGATVLVAFWWLARTRGPRAGVAGAAGCVLLFAVAEALLGVAGAPRDPFVSVALFLLVTAAWRMRRFADDASVANGLVAGASLGAMPVFVGRQLTFVYVILLVRWLSSVRPVWRCWPVVAGVTGTLAWLGWARG